IGKLDPILVISDQVIRYAEEREERARASGRAGEPASASNAALLAKALLYKSFVLVKRDEIAAAIEHADKARRLLAEVSRREPGNASHLSDYVRACSFLGMSRARGGDRERAREHFA